MAVPSEKSSSLKWSGDFSLPRFRAKLANQFNLHPDVAPGYDDLYLSYLGARTIVRKDYASSSPSLAGSGMSSMARSGSGTSLSRLGSDASASSLPGLGRSSSVPTLGLRRMEVHPAVVRLGKNAMMDKTGKPAITGGSSPEEKKEREKELNSEAMSRRLWAAAHGSEIHIREYIELRKDDPAISLKGCPVPGMQKALKSGAKLDWKNDEWDGATLLIKAIRSDSAGLVEYLLAIGADPLVIDKSGRSVFHWASMIGNPDVMELLLNAIPDPTAQVQAPDSGGDTPLHLAAYHGHLPVIRLLVRQKVDPLQPNTMGYSAIELAEARRMWHIAHYLMEQKNQQEDQNDEDFQIRKLVRPCNLYRADELRGIAELNPKPKAKAAAKKK